MKTQRTKRALTVLAVAVGMTEFNSAALAQSADALIDKLVEKGILSVKEANELREEADKNFTTAYSVKSGMPEWVTSLKFNGDLRGRYESLMLDNPSAANSGNADRNRFRYRARFGVTATMWNQLEAGLRLGSGDLDGGVPAGGIDPISNNQSFQNNGSKKGIFLDLAYARWSPVNTPAWTGTLTAGKMENPFTFPSTMLFDRDYTPEGATMELTYRLHAEHTLKFIGGGFVLDELSLDSNDPFLASTQLRWDASWNPRWSSSVGISYWNIESEENLGSAGVPNVGGGNTRNAGGALVNEYRPVEMDASLTYTAEKFPFYPLAFPITVFGEYLDNTSVSEEDEGYAVGIIFGKSGKRGTWDLSYQYRVLEGDAWYEELTESDFGANYVAAPVGGAAGYRNGTNVRGHIFKIQYSPYDSFSLGVTYWLTELVNESPAGLDSGSGRLQVDATLKF